MGFVDCTCGHDIERHDDAGCPADRCRCKHNFASALDGAIASVSATAESRALHQSYFKRRTPDAARPERS